MADGAARLSPVGGGKPRGLRVRAKDGKATLTRRLPRREWAVSLDFRVAPMTSASFAFGSGHAQVHVRRARGGAVAVRMKRGSRLVFRGSTRGAARSLHLEARWDGTTIEVGIGDLQRRFRTRRARSLVLHLRRGGLALEPLLVTRSGGRALLLLHRVAELNSRVPRHRFLSGADRQNRLYFNAGSWMRGFLAGSLWEAGAMIPGRDPFERAALKRTRAAFGAETADTHDLGFMYENSSVAAYRRLCRGGGAGEPICDQLSESALEAADALLELQATNSAAGTIPTRQSGPGAAVADTIIDSMMNLPLLYWASDFTGDPTYRAAAAAHAHRVAELLVRRDGSTAQSVHFDRATGEVLLIHTHQGASTDSTWARGQGWAVYGFTTSAAALRDPGLLRNAERTAAWVGDHIPASGVPPYDYDAPLGAPEDTSAAVITAAGMLRLARLCERWSGACEQPGRWLPLGRRLLRAALRYVSQSLPLGFLDQQVGTFRGRTSWDAGAELVFGLRYALEAVRLSQLTGRG